MTSRLVPPSASNEAQEPPAAVAVFALIPVIFALAAAMLAGSLRSRGRRSAT